MVRYARWPEPTTAIELPGIIFSTALKAVAPDPRKIPACSGYMVSGM